MDIKKDINSIIQKYNLCSDADTINKIVEELYQLLASQIETSMLYAKQSFCYDLADCLTNLLTKGIDK